MSHRGLSGLTWSTCPQFREGVGLLASDYIKWMNGGGWRYLIEGESKVHFDRARASGDSHVLPGVRTMADALDNVVDRVKETKLVYEDSIRSLRGVIDNDLKKVEKMATGLEVAMKKVGRATRETIGIWTGEEMALAIQNAERLVAALEAISNVNGAKVAFSVVNVEHEPS